MKGDVIYVNKKIDGSFSRVFSGSSDGGIFTSGGGSGSSNGGAAASEGASYFTYRHYGIDLGNDEVVHFTGNLPKDYRITISSKYAFAGGGMVHVDDDIQYFFSKEETVWRALGMVGTDFGGYDFLNNNCEHFTTWCAAGCKKSRQSKNAKTMSKYALMLLIMIITGRPPIYI